MGIGAWLDARGDQHDEWIACVSSADLHADVTQPNASKEPVERRISEAEALVAKTGAYPLLVVFAQIENDQPAARAQNPHRLCQGLFRIRGMVQRLREERDVY